MRTGTLSGGTARAFTLVVLPDGGVWAFYGARAGGGLSPSGFVQGRATFSGSSLSAPQGRDFGAWPATTAAVTATVDAATGAVSGTIGAGVTVSLQGSALAGYDFAAPASPASVAGTWTGTNQNGEAVTVTLAADGSLAGTAGAVCAVSGRATPTATGRNVLDVSVTQGQNCALPGQTLTGIAIVYPIDGGRRQLLLAVRDAGATAGVALQATR